MSFTDTVIGWITTSSDGNDVLQNVEIAVEGSGQRNLLVGSTGFAGIQAASECCGEWRRGPAGGGDLYGQLELFGQRPAVIAQPSARDQRELH